MSTLPWEPTPLDAPARASGEDQAETTGGNSIMRVIPEPSDPTAQQRMRLIELSGVLDFWDGPEENIYSPEDGEPL